MAVKQYPYTLRVMQITGGGFDSDGNPIEPTSTYVDYCKCRDEANSGGKQINLIDGSAHVFDSLVQTPKGTSPVDVGTSVQVLDATSVVRVSGTVKRSQKDQLHTRIWV